MIQLSILKWKFPSRNPLNDNPEDEERLQYGEQITCVVGVTLPKLIEEIPRHVEGHEVFTGRKRGASKGSNERFPFSRQATTGGGGGRLCQFVWKHCDDKCVHGQGIGEGEPPEL